MNYETGLGSNPVKHETIIILEIVDVICHCINVIEIITKNLMKMISIINEICFIFDTSLFE